MVVALILTYRSVRQSETSNANVGHTQRVLSALVALESATADLVFAPSDPAISVAAAAVSDRVNELTSLTVDNDAQQARLAELGTQLPEIIRNRRTAIQGGLMLPTQAIVPQRLSQVLRGIRLEELRRLTVSVTENT